MSIPTIIQAAPGSDVYCYTCPQCGAQEIGHTPPRGWWITTPPFPTVVACDMCVPPLLRRWALQSQGLDA